MMADIDFDDFERMVSDPATTADELRIFTESIGLKGDFAPGEIFTVGIVAPDAIRTRLNVTPDAFQNLVKVLTASDGIRSWQVFPKGIVVPDGFAVEVDVGRRSTDVGGG
jgi:hypothetical protein